MILDMIERMASDRTWIYTGIAGALFGAAFLFYIKDTRIGLWAYSKFDQCMDWLRDTLGITMLDQDPEAWRKVNPKIAAKIDELEARIDNLNNNAIKIAAVAERDSAKIDKLEERANTQLMMDMVSK